MKPVVAPKGWDVVESVGRDGSTRRYFRVEKAGRKAILMDCTQGETPGHALSDFIRIGEWLNGIGLKAPQVYEGDVAAGYVVAEDFGDVSFKKALNKDNAGELYGVAADVLSHLRGQTSIPALPEYYESFVHKGRRRIIDWYAPLARHEKNPPGFVEDYLAVWDEIEKSVPSAAPGFVHVDFHVENLMWLPGEKGVKRCGILDFQGAMRGPGAYDMGNLLEDVRIDVPLEIRDRYLAAQDDDFKIRYRILTTQFHCRVLGQFIRLAAKDYKTGYLQYIPRVQMLIRQALEEPFLQPLKEFLENNNISLEAKPDLKNIKVLVAEDAF